MESRKEGVQEYSYLMVSLYFVRLASRGASESRGSGVKVKKKRVHLKEMETQTAKQPGGLVLLKLETPKTLSNKSQLSGNRNWNSNCWEDFYFWKHGRDTLAYPLMESD